MDTTLDYLDIPSTATLLHSSRFQPAPKITTSLPSPSPPISAPTSPTTDSIPNFILSATLPTGIFPPSTPTTPMTSSTSSAAAGAPQAPTLPSHTRNPSKSSNRSAPLLSSKDPLSLPTTSTNFRRFIACVGPAFWIQDRVEEIVLWKKGWKWTTLWVLLYGGLCRFPQLILCIPHITLIGVILATYPYPATHNSTLSQSQSLPQPPPLAGQRSPNSQTQDPPPVAPHTATSSLTSLPYQSNLQAIQNLMGTFSDLMDFVKPFVGHLVLSPASLSAFSHSRSASSSSSASSNSSSSILNTQSSPYTIHILALLVLTLPPLLIFVSLPSFPLRLAMFIAGAGPIFALHPWVKDEVLPALIVVAIWAWNRPIPVPLICAYMRIVRLTRSISGLDFINLIRRDVEVKEPQGSQDFKTLDNYYNHTALKSLIEKLIDNDRLADECWMSEMRQVELWENERYVGPLPAVETGGQGLATKPSFSSIASVGSMTSLASFGSLKSLGSIGSTGARKGTWSKANLRPTDRAGWTRWRDGWNGATSSTAVTDGQERQDVYDEDAGVDSRLTFPLAPGWSFVDTEDWRKDVSAEWALAVGDGDRTGMVDEDGWVYTNDSWMEGTPYVTRRRRWVRRVWFDPNKAKEYRVLSEV